MKIYGGTKAQKRKLIVSAIENVIVGGIICGGGMLFLRFTGAILKLIGAA